MNADAVVLCVSLFVVVVIACAALEIVVDRHRRNRYGHTEVEYVDWHV